jgi:hypothetical protein
MFTKQKKNEKIILCPLVKYSHFSYGNGLFPKNIYYAFIVHKMQKNTFFE